MNLFLPVRAFNDRFYFSAAGEDTVVRGVGEGFRLLGQLFGQGGVGYRSASEREGNDG